MKAETIRAIQYHLNRAAEDASRALQEAKDAAASTWGKTEDVITSPFGDRELTLSEKMASNVAKRQREFDYAKEVLADFQNHDWR